MCVQQVEDRGKLPKQTEEQRKAVLSTTAGSITYIAAIMREIARGDAL